MSKQLFILVNEAVRERAINWLLKMPLGMMFKRGVLDRKRSGSFNVYSLAFPNAVRTSGIFG